MRTITATEAQGSFGALLSSARHEAVQVTEDGKPAVVILPAADYERLLGEARADLKQTLERLRASAAGRGLTEEKLAELLADDS
jgi:prevent-host-death family protein